MRLCVNCQKGEAAFCKNCKTGASLDEIDQLLSSLIGLIKIEMKTSLLETLKDMKASGLAIFIREPKQTKGETN